MRITYPLVQQISRFGPFYCFAYGLAMAWLTTKTSQRVGSTENETCKVKRGFSSVFSCACLQTELGNGNLKQTESLPHGSPLLGFRHNQRFGFVNLSTHHSTRR